MKILLNDLLNLSDEDIEKARVKLNMETAYSDPIEVYKSNPDEINSGWFLWHNDRRYFPYVGVLAIFLVRIVDDSWLLTTIKEIDKLLPVKDAVGYEAHEIGRYKKYFGRVIVNYHNRSMAIGRKFSEVLNEMEVLQVLTDQFTGDEFPGYDNVRLSYPELKRIIDRKLPGWFGALSNQKAIYLQVDKATGKMYVGSATSQRGMLLQRWSDYVANGHGGNVELKRIVKENGFDYIKKNFQYVILENYNAKVDDSYILSREKWWKKTLLSIQFGYNDNL